MDILDAAASGNDAELADVSTGRKYISGTDPQDFVMELTTATILVHDNPESGLNGMPFLAFTGRVTEINGECNASKKQGTTYVTEECRVGDELGRTIELATVGIKKGKQRYNLLDAAEMAALLADGDLRQDDFLPKGTPGPAGIKETFSDPAEHLGKLVHVYTDGRPNKSGYYTLKFALIPQAKKKGKAA